MTLSVIELINRNKPQINKSIDLTLSRRTADGQTYVDGMPDPSLNGFFPETSYLTQIAAFMRFLNRRPTLAYIRGTDAEVITDRDTVDLSENTIGNVGIAKGVYWTEKDFKIIKQIRDLQAAGGAGNTAAAQELLDVYLTTPARLTDSWLNTLRMLCQRVSVSGKALYTDEFSEVPVELDYTSLIPSGHLASTKTGNARWSQPTTANGTADIISHLNAYYANLRMFPSAIVMGSTEADSLRNQNSTRLKVARFMGRLTSETDPTDASVLPRPTLADIQAYIQSELTSAAQGAAVAPEIVITDAIYYQRRKATGAVVSAPYLPSGYYHFAMPNYIEAAKFPTASNDFQGGLAIKTKRDDFVPVTERLAVDGCGIPLVPDPRWIASRNVENTAIS